MQVVAGHLRASRAAIPVVRTTFSSWLPSLSRSTTHAAHRTITGSPATAAIRTVVANELDTVFVEISVSTRKLAWPRVFGVTRPLCLHCRALPGAGGVRCDCAATDQRLCSRLSCSASIAARPLPAGTWTRKIHMRRTVVHCRVEVRCLMPPAELGHSGGAVVFPFNWDVRKAAEE